MNVKPLISAINSFTTSKMNMDWTANGLSTYLVKGFSSISRCTLKFRLHSEKLQNFHFKPKLSFSRQNRQNDYQAEFSDFHIVGFSDNPKYDFFNFSRK